MPWAAPDNLQVSLSGLDLDKVWENIVAGLAGVQVQQGTTLEEQLALAQKRGKLQKEIAKLEKLAWAEKQPKRKFELMRSIETKKQAMKELSI